MRAQENFRCLCTENSDVSAFDTVRVIFGCVCACAFQKKTVSYYYTTEYCMRILGEWKQKTKARTHVTAKEKN